MTHRLPPEDRNGRLSEKEEHLLTLLARGYKTSEIAETIGITTHYVYFLARMLKARFGVDTNAAVISRAIVEGIISADGTLLRQDEKGGANAIK